MGNVEVKINLQGINEVMRSPEIAAAISAAGEAVASAAGDGYGTRSGAWDYIAYCNVFPDSKEAAKENYEENTIVKAAGAVGLPFSK